MSYMSCPIDQAWDRYCAEQDKLVARLPVCCECGQHIEDDMCWLFGDEPMCDDCAERYRKFTVDLMR